MSSYPEVYLIGAMKSGTTTLTEYLGNHDRIFLCPNKEPGYFSRDERFAKGEAYYLEQFVAAREDQIKVDASTCYSRWPYYDKTINRLFAANPNAKFIYILRDPVYRTYSHYRHRMMESILSGIETVSFEQAMKTDKEMMYASDYALQISKYLDIFQKKQFYFTTLDLLKGDPRKVLNGIYEFLSLNPNNQLNSIKALHENKAGDKIKHNVALKQLEKYTNFSLIQKFKYLVPFELRCKIKDHAYSLLRHYRASSPEEWALNCISELTEENIIYLRNYFSTSVIDTELITGLDLSPWK